MGTRIQLTPEQEEAAWQQAIAAVHEYNATHTDTQMSVRPLPGGNVQIVIEKV